MGKIRLTWFAGVQVPSTAPRDPRAGHGNDRLVSWVDEMNLTPLAPTSTESKPPELTPYVIHILWQEWNQIADTCPVSAHS